MTTSLKNLPPWSDEEGIANVIVDTPKGSRNKYKFDEKLGVFKLSHLLAAGLVFPFNFGYIPGTRGGDGDPLDVIVLIEEPLFSGCVVPTRLVGVIEAEQTQEGKTNRNDRLIGVACQSRVYGAMRDLEDVGEKLVDEIEHFFIAYNVMRNRKFQPLARRGAAHVRKMVEDNSE